MLRSKGFVIWIAKEQMLHKKYAKNDRNYETRKKFGQLSFQNESSEYPFIIFLICFLSLLSAQRPSCAARAGHFTKVKKRETASPRVAFFKITAAALVRTSELLYGSEFMIDINFCLMLNHNIVPKATCSIRVAAKLNPVFVAH